MDGALLTCDSVLLDLGPVAAGERRGVVELAAGNGDAGAVVQVSYNFV